MRILVFTFICMMSFSFTQAQTRVDAGDITQNLDIKVPIYKVAITSSDANVSALAKKAFRTHGSYNIVPEAQAQFIFNFENVGNTTKLNIKGSGSYMSECSADSKVASIMKACDLAVEKTLRKPSYFNSKIAFSLSKNNKTSEICVSDLVFNKVQLLTNDSSDSILPHFNPSGTKLTYTGYFRSGFMDLFEIDVAKKQRKTIASFKGSNTGGTYSPDGSKIALILSTTGSADVWTVNANGKGFKRMTSTKATESSPSFSPDGSKILFVTDVRGGPQLYTMPSTGGKATAIATNISRYCAEPVWSVADPSKIAFTAAMGKGFQIAVYDFTTRKSKFITRGESSSTPAWLNDGRHLVYTKRVGKSTVLYIADTATCKEVALHSTSFGITKDASVVYLK